MMKQNLQITPIPKSSGTVPIPNSCGTVPMHHSSGTVSVGNTSGTVSARLNTDAPIPDGRNTVVIKVTKNTE